MITIMFQYFCKKENKWKDSSKRFDSRKSAVKFAYSMKNKMMVITGFSCYDSEDCHYLDRALNFAEINGNIYGREYYGHN